MIFWIVVVIIVLCAIIYDWLLELIALILFVAIVYGVIILILRFLRLLKAPVNYFRSADGKGLLKILFYIVVIIFYPIGMISWIMYGLSHGWSFLIVMFQVVMCGAVFFLFLDRTLPDEED